VDEKRNTGFSRQKQLVADTRANTANSSTGERAPAVPRLAAGESRFVLAAQMRLLARRAQLGLPLDRRSIANALRLCKTLEVRG
jgi:hypothetical protein